MSTWTPSFWNVAKLDRLWILAVKIGEDDRVESVLIRIGANPIPEVVPLAVAEALIQEIT